MSEEIELKYAYCDFEKVGPNWESGLRAFFTSIGAL
jgi:hypothetical protein